MKKVESVFIYPDNIVSRESVYKFFSGTQFHVSKPPRFEAKVTMRTDQHDPDFFQDIIVNIQLYDKDGSKRRRDLGSVVISLDLLLTPFPDDIILSIESYVRKQTEIDSRLISNELTKISMVIKAYAEAFVRWGAELKVVAETQERKAVRTFLSGKGVLHRVAGFIITVQMSVNNCDYEGFKDNLIIINVMQPDLSSVGFVITKVGRIYSFDIQTQLNSLDLTEKETDAIEEHIRHQLLRFETLGPVPTITPDAL
ncbi:hypothetical protein A1A1_10906 [Planococcus antarcticus DSM 14505]|uniref:Uncharacterized protein n=1 Tax=Planococcus antarcticus DSM 14505 TaxID=1185653 RepID=A0AA87IKE6_9BACL|nr:hypothetical protein [Planococcus antarcticus]EIM06455.1 hypothetical protein A1A1_10906 [Planococcus antarcticus DSM 14505]